MTEICQRPLPSLMVAKPGRRTSRRQSAGRTGAAEHEHEAKRDPSPARGRSNERAARRRASSSVERDRNVVLAVREKHDCLLYTSDAADE